MSDDEFRETVQRTIDTLPEEFLAQLDNVEIVIEDVPEDAQLLGLYHGVPKTHRLSYSALPDKIKIFKQPILHMSRSVDEAKKNIRDTVLHEIGHHFGLSDEELYRIKK